MAKSILITGASGRLGSALTRALSQNHEIAKLSLDPTDSPELASIGQDHVGSVTDAQTVERAMDGVDTVIHCASYPGAIGSFYDLMETNVLGTFRLLEEAGRRPEVERFIYISSIAWHGLHEDRGGRHAPHYLPIDEKHPSLASGYSDSSKVHAELLCETYTRRFKKPTVAVRPAWIISEDLSKNFKAAPPVTEAHLNDYVGVADVTDAIERTLEYDPPNGFDAFLLHAEDQRSICPSVELVERYFSDVPYSRAVLERCEGFGAFVDCAHARDALGWTPRFRCIR